MSEGSAKANGGGPVEHRFSDFYSGDKPVPNVQQYKENRDEKYEPELDNTELDDKAEYGTGEREVFDPITRRTVSVTDRGGTKTVQDVNITVPKTALRRTSGDSDRVKKDELDREEANREDQADGTKERGTGFVDVPMHGDKTNILYFPFPAPEWDYYHSQVRKLVYQYGAALVVIAYLVHFSSLGWVGGIIAAIFMAIGVHNLDRQLVGSWHDVKFDVERQRGRSVFPH
jgi:hypothetical protein